ncbi:MAG: cell division protein ZipA C-terminal FtsZ-binding domain-containing protein [Bdellovibrio sp.]|nr:cell division protein ZipA C-terminal FtsZ-binding domain-containing protein [Methylotenera sp.]
MSDLKVVLIVLGALIIAGVLVYNWLQERKLRNEVSRDFIVPQKDVLTDDFYIDSDAYVEKELAGVGSKTKASLKATAVQTEQAQVLTETSREENIDEPTLAVADDATFLDAAVKNDTNTFAQFNTSHIESADNSFFSVADVRIDALPESIVKADLYQQAQGVQANLPSIIHPQIDLTAIFYATKSIESADLQTLNSAIADIGLPIMMHGLDVEDKWHLLSDNTPSAAFKQVACSLQLADRGGPVAKNLLNKFQFAVEDAGLSLNAHVEWQTNGDALQRAIELDQFCIEVDQIISVHMAQNESPIHGTKFKGLAEASGLSLMADGKFHYLQNGKSEPLFVLLDSNNQPFTAENLRTNVLKSVTFQIEMPKVSNCEQVFNQMIAIAQKMAQSLNARLVDDNQRLLGDVQIEKIRQQLKIIHATMVARGIMPGSPASIRLFG